MKKRYIVNIEQEEYVVEIQDEQVFINGVLAEDSFFSALNDQGLYLIQSGMEKEEIHIQREKQNEFRITVDGHHLKAQIEQDTGRSNRKKKNTTANNGNVSAPMPALIVEISVAEGETVETGQTLLILEAMKMQMKVKAQMTGTVKRIHKTAGDRVEKDDLLMILSPQKEHN